MPILFYIFGAVVVIAALGVILQRTPVYSALLLIVVLCALAVEYLLLGAEFIAVIQVIVYAGAIMVLFVLVIMLLNAGHEVPSSRSRMAGLLGAPLLLAFSLEIIYAVMNFLPAESVNWQTAKPSGPAPIGHLLFKSYILPFEVTSVLILVAVLGAVVLAKREL